MPRGVYPRKPKKAPTPRPLEEVKSHPVAETLDSGEKLLISLDDLCKFIAEAAVRGYKQK